MVRWARDRRVFFIEEPLLDCAALRFEVREGPSGVRVVTPHLPGGIGAMSGLLEALVEDQALEHFISWYSTPKAISYSGHLAPAAVIYDCLDELSPLHDSLAERELLRRADVVFTSGQRLWLAKKSQHPNVHAFPCSVDVEHFLTARSPQADPQEQASIPHPRLGFYGALDERLDFELIAAIAELRPDWHFVLRGAVMIDPARLPRRPNLHYLGHPPYAQLPQAVAGWDVALLPFAINEATRVICPAQMLEYLAAGRPVISTPIHDVVHDAGELGLVHIARSPAQFQAAITASLLEDREERFQHADAFLAGRSWDHTWSQMKSEVEGLSLEQAPFSAGLLGARRPEPLRRVQGRG